MTNKKELNNKIISIRNTQKITKAMEMVAASKMLKSQNRMLASRNYANAICKVINHLAISKIECKLSYSIERKVKRIGYLIVSTDQGLCGDLNISLFKNLLADMEIWLNKGIQSYISIIGCKGAFFFNSIGVNIIEQITNIGDNPSISKFTKLIKLLLKNYNEGFLDKIYIASNKFINNISQTPTIKQLLPLSVLDNKKSKYKFCYYLYEPDSKELVDNLIYYYIESQVYQSILENLASEQAARMVAMKTATDNSGNLINELQLLYNKTRQTNITKELAEIVSGAFVN